MPPSIVFRPTTASCHDGRCDVMGRCKTSCLVIRVQYVSNCQCLHVTAATCIIRRARYKRSPSTTAADLAHLRVRRYRTRTRNANLFPKREHERHCASLRHLVFPIPLASRHPRHGYVPRSSPAPPSPNPYPKRCPSRYGACGTHRPIGGIASPFLHCTSKTPTERPPAASAIPIHQGCHGLA